MRQDLPRLARLGLVSAVLVMCVLGCERKPEDLEKWRNAEGGMEKMMEWAKNKKESMPVRQRAVQILLEQDRLNELSQMFASMKDEAARAELMTVVVSTVEELWAAKDYPVMTEEMKTKGATVPVGDSKSLRAVEAAYLFHPYAAPEDQKKFEAILGEWLSADHELRSLLSKRVTLEQLLPLSGDKGFDGMMRWFSESKKPGNLARTIRDRADDKTKARFDAVIKERAEREHPDLSEEMRVIVIETESEVIVPYLERAIRDPKSSAGLADDAMDAYVRIMGPRSTTLLNELVRDRKDLMRSVAFTRLVELRGTAGVLQGINALPLELDKYTTTGDNTLEKDSSYLCNIIQSELEKTHDVKDPRPVIKQIIETPRWPAQVIGMRCAELFKYSDWKVTIEGFAADKQVVPGWGPEGTTVGDIATQTLTKL